MNTNDIFNFRRFGKYFASDFRTCQANYGLSLIVITILIQVGLYVTTVALNGVFLQTWGGPGIGLRLSAFIVAIFCLTVTMPVKCYGRLTEKQYGSFWISLPASKLEKFISMVIMTCIIVPVIGVTVYIAFDWLICLVDKTCEGSLISWAISLSDDVNSMLDKFAAALNNQQDTMVGETTLTAEAMMRVFNQATSPWLYIDEYLCMCLPFLLGAIFFKSAKTVKTFLAIAAVSSAISMITSPLFVGYYMDLLNEAITEDEAMARMFNSVFFQNIAWVDIISDAIMNSAVLACIWLRIKTLKH